MPSSSRTGAELDAPSPGDTATLGADTLAAPGAPTARSTPPTKHPARPRTRGELLGRYLLLAELGAGAMGVVWAAYDPELDRRVALKLLVGGHDSERLLREAQALARLAHPNVVAVYDAGETDGDVWLAMELVDGVTFKTWLKRQPVRLGWREVLAALIPAGRGVAAAHAAGLIHRDLKPDNIMVGGDGRTRVMDFGLARAGETFGTTELVPSDDPLVSRSSVLSTDVTRTGALLGTPAYMAPEQLSGRAHEGSDVFAFAVVLWEALYGLRPFGGETIAATVLAITRGTYQTPGPGPRVPRWLRRVLERGLASLPSARWPSINAMLDALERGLARVTRVRIATALLATLALVGAGSATAALDRSQRIATCEAAGAAIEAVWPGQAEAVALGMTRAGLGFARTSHEKIVPMLDAWALKWRQERSAACIAATVDDTLAPELAERAETCLELQQATATSLLEQLAGGAPTALNQAITATTSLSLSPSCADRRRLEQGVWPASDQRAKVHELRTRVARASILQLIGDYDGGLTEARAIRGEAEALGWAPLLAELDLLIGHLLQRKGQFAEAEKTLRAAFFAAGRVHADRLAARAATELTLIVGNELRRHTEGLEWGELAAMFLAREGDEEELEQATLLGYVAAVRDAEGAPEVALPLAERALAIQERVLGPEHLALSRTLNNLALILQSLGRNQEARAMLERTLAIRETTQGADHPDLALPLNNLALAIMKTGDDATALPIFERAIALHEANRDGDNPRIASALNNIAMLYARREELDKAIEFGERALEIRERTLGPEHPLVASSLNNLAIAHANRGAPDRALELHQRALKIRESKLGPDHPDVARSLTNIGEIHDRQGRTRLALPLLERALEIRTAKEVAPQDLAYTRFALAQALDHSGERERAGQLARAAAEAYRRAADERAAEVDEWLAIFDRTAGQRSKRRK